MLNPWGICQKLYLTGAPFLILLNSRESLAGHRHCMPIFMNFGEGDVKSVNWQIRNIYKPLIDKI